MIQKKAVTWLRQIVGTLLFLCAAVNSGWAGNNGYFTTYNSQVEKGEIELMIMNDFTSPSKFRREQEGFGQYWSHMLELEYGVSDQFASEFMIESFEDPDKHQSAFGGFRWENRYRLFKEDVPLNPMVYVEYENLDPRTRYKMEVSGWAIPPYEEPEGDKDRERIMETRGVFSQDFGALNLAFNWINETNLDSRRTAFGYAVAAMYMIHHAPTEVAAGAVARYSCPMHPEVIESSPGHCPKCGMELSPSDHSGGCTCKEHMPSCNCAHCASGGSCTCAHAGGIGIGLELYGALGDTKSFGLNMRRQEHYFGPIFMYHITNKWMAHIQLANGLSKASDNLVRFNVGYEF